MMGFVVVFGILVLDTFLVKGLTLLGFTQITSAIIVVGSEIGSNLGQLAQAIREKSVDSVGKPIVS
jgi:flagellar motor component MotA